MRQPYTDHRDEAFPNVIAGDGDFVFLFLQHSGRRCKVIDGARQGRPEAGKVRAAIDGVDGVRKSKNVFAVGIVVLQRDFDLHSAALALEVDRRIMQRGFSAIQMLDELRDAAGELEFRGLFRALVGERDLQAFIQKGQFAQALRQGVKTVHGLLENRGIRMEGNFCPGLAGLTGLLQFVGGLALFVGLFPHLAVPRDFQLQPIGKRVDHRNAHAVETTRDFVGVAVKFSASVQHRQHNFRCGALLRRMHVHRDAPAVVHHGDRVVGVHGDVDLIGITGHRFIDRIVHHFPDQMVQAHLSGGADIHRGAQPHGLQAAENFDGLGVVLVAALRRSHHVFFVAHAFSWSGNFSPTAAPPGQTPGNSQCGSALKTRWREARKACLGNSERRLYPVIPASPGESETRRVPAPSHLARARRGEDSCFSKRVAQLAPGREPVGRPRWPGGRVDRTGYSTTTGLYSLRGFFSSI